MLAKYVVEFATPFRRHSQASHYTTDDPVACEEFIEELLEKGCLIQAIRHEGVDLNSHQFDRMIKIAAGMLAGKRICASLQIKTEEEKYSFGFTN